MILGTNLLFIHKDLINPINPLTYIFKIVKEIQEKFTLNSNLTAKMVNKDELCMPCYDYKSNKNTNRWATWPELMSS